MSRKQEQARQLVENGLLDELISDYQEQQYKAFISGDSKDDLEQIYSRARAGRDLGHYINNRARDILDGK